MPDMAKRAPPPPQVRPPPPQVNGGVSTRAIVIGQRCCQSPVAAATRARPATFSRWIIGQCGGDARAGGFTAFGVGNCLKRADGGSGGWSFALPP